MPDHAELAVVSHFGPDSRVVRSLVSQLLEHGVYFEPGPDRALLRDVPGDLDAYRAVILDAPAFAAAVADPVCRERLESYARGAGFVFRISDPVEKDHGGYLDSMLVDTMTRDQVQDMLAHAPLSHGGNPPHARSDFDVVNELAARVAESVRRLRGWTEMTLHFWKAARALIEVGGHDALCEDLMTAIRETAAEIPPATNHDRVGGYFGTVWLHDRTGERGPMERARARLDELLARRPRCEGIPTGTGFEDDPLLCNDRDGLFSFFFSDTIVRRRALWNEGLHMYGPTLGALARGTGDRRYLEEALRYVEYIGRVHQREDGLIEHASHNGRPNGIVWSRGMLHALIGMVYLLEEMDRDEPGFDLIVSILDRAGRGLAPCQDVRTGLWRNVVDHPDARLESSGTAGFCYVYARCLREGWLDRATHEAMIDAAWHGIKRMVWRGGLSANCRGSGAAVDLHYYLGRPQGYSNGPPTCWALMAGLERLISREEHKRNMPAS